MSAKKADLVNVTVDVYLLGGPFATFSGVTDGSGEVTKTYTNAPSGVYSCDVVDIGGSDASEPVNDHDKGIDLVPDADCG